MVNVLELVFPLISAALLIGYHLFWIVEIVKYPHRINLTLALRVKRAWIKTNVVNIAQNNVFIVQALRNGIMASTFFATLSSAIAFLLINLSVNSQGLLKVAHFTIQYLAAAGILFLTFLNMGVVIRNHNNAGYLITVGRNLENEEGELPIDGRLETLHDKATILLKRAQIHWNVGVRLFFIALLVGAWAFSPILLLIVTALLVILLYYYDHI